MSLLLDPPAHPSRSRAEQPPGTRPTRASWIATGARVPVVLGFLVLAAGIALRFLATSPLWLDEAQSVAIARLPLPQLVDALRQDGSPPLYYLLLHGWIALVGTGSSAVRALSGLLSVAALPVVWLLATRLYGRRAGWVALLLTASSPFLLRYATETRMYSLLVLLTALGGLALQRVLAGPSRRGWILLAASSGALLLTHYWSLFLLTVLGGWLLVQSLRADQPAAYRRAVTAVAAGGLFLVPWLPSMLFQLRHTGTPWAGRPQLVDVVGTLGEWAGPRTTNAPILMLLLAGLAVLGAAGRALPDGRISLDPRGLSPGRVLLGLSFGTLLLACLVGLIGGGAYAARYTSVAFVPFLLLVAAGIGVVQGRRARVLVLAAAVGLGLGGGVQLVFDHRTEAGVIASALAEQARAGDVVVYCPDQLGPAVSRVLDQRHVTGLDQRVYPTGAAPQRVDWVDYAARNAAASPTLFAAAVDREAGTNRVWVVSAPGYRTFGDACGQISEVLGALRQGPAYVVRARPSYAERADLIRFGPA